jgi:hypothetical protein
MLCLKIGNNIREDFLREIIDLAHRVPLPLMVIGYCRPALPAGWGSYG